MLDTEDDPIVHEVDVYLSKQLAQQLYLFQYPVRPASMPYDDISHLSARIKPEQQRVELELSVNIHSPNYSKSKGEQIVLNVDGSGPSSQPRMYSSDKMDKQVIASIPTGVSPNRYVAGTYRDGELHLTPLKGIVQLRPSFGYLDRADTKGRGPGGAGDAEDTVEDEEPEVKPVTVKFARRETEEAKARRMASYEYISKKREEEPWVHVRHHQMCAPMAEAQRMLLLASQTTEISEFQVQPQHYLERLIPNTVEEDQQRPPMPTNVLSLAELKTMTLSDQIKALLCNAKIIRFAQLMSLLTKGTDPTAALRALQPVALLVQGCWVVKSEVIYPKDSCSPFSGAPAEALCRGRDYIMWRFTQNRFVIRKDISTVVKLTAEDVKEILKQMACLRVNKGWEFMFEYDSEFVNRHPEVVQRQQMLWDAKFQQLTKTLKISKADLDRKAKSAELAAASPEKPKRRRTVSRTKSGSERSFSDQSDTDGETQKERTRRSSGTERPRKNSSSERSRRNSGRERNLSGSQENMSTLDLAPPGPSERSLAEIAATSSQFSSQAMNGDAAMPHAVSSEMKKELIMFVRERMTSRFVLSLSELRLQLMRHLAGCPAGHILATGVSDKLLQETVLESGGVQAGQSSSSDPIFAMTLFGDHLDNVRTALLAMPGLTKGFRSTAFKRRFEEEKGQTLSDADLRKVIRDYCASKGGQWCLKGSDL